MNEQGSRKYKIKATDQLDYVGVKRLSWYFLEIVALEQRHTDAKGQLKRKGSGGHSSKGNSKEQRPRGS